MLIPWRTAEGFVFQRISYRILNDNHAMWTFIHLTAPVLLYLLQIHTLQPKPLLDEKRSCQLRRRVLNKSAWHWLSGHVPWVGGHGNCNCTLISETKNKWTCYLIYSSLLFKSQFLHIWDCLIKVKDQPYSSKNFQHLSQSPKLSVPIHCSWKEWRLNWKLEDTKWLISCHQLNSVP